MPEQISGTFSSYNPDHRPVLSPSGSWLELLHPDRITPRYLVLGKRSTAGLNIPSLKETTDRAGLIILAPSAAECRTSGWLENAAQQASQKMESDGLVYVLAPVWKRWQIAKLLSKHHIFLNQSFLHLPNRTVSQYLLPLDPISVRYLISKIATLSPWARWLITAAVLVFPCHSLLQHLSMSVGMVFRRPGARPLYEWLSTSSPAMNRLRNVILRTSWRGPRGATILYCFVGNESLPFAIAKVHTGSQAGELVGREAKALDCLGPDARKAGALVPQRVTVTQAKDHAVLVETVISGHSAALLLSSRPNRLNQIVREVISWLASWNRSTMIVKPLYAECLERELLRSAALLGPQLKHGEEYRKWLEGFCSRLHGVTIPRVAAHNDLTAWNILFGDQEQLGVVDWESASEQGLPFVDFFYVVTDVVGLATMKGDRFNAFKACFADGGAYEHVMKQYLTDLRRVTPVTDETIELCFHACWLSHAANEYSVTDSSTPRPFLEIMQWLAVNRSQVSKWVRA